MESVRGLMPASERWSSLKRRGAWARSRSIRRVHFPDTIWAVARTGHVTPAASGALLDPMIVADATRDAPNPGVGRDDGQWPTRAPAANVGRARVSGPAIARAQPAPPPRDPAPARPRAPRVGGRRRSGPA